MSLIKIINVTSETTLYFDHYFGCKLGVYYASKKERKVPTNVYT